MRKSIRKMVWIRVAATIGSVVLLSAATTTGIFQIKSSQADSQMAANLLDRAQKATVAHYKWSSGLSNALYAGKEFTGSMDPTTCVLGEWIYGEAGTEDADVLALRQQLEPLHKQLHESAKKVLDMLGEDPAGAQAYYQNTIQANLSTLVGLLDDVVAKSTELSQASAENMKQTIHMMQVMTGIFGLLALFCLISLILYVFKAIVRPILYITKKTAPLKEGKLQLALDYQAEDEIGELAKILEQSLAVIRSYVKDINRIMQLLSQGRFDVHTETPFIGDFKSIEQSIDSLTSTLSLALGKIGQAERRVSSNAEQLSSSSQALAQGATEQASSVEEMFATLDMLSKNASGNVAAATNAQENARLAREQVTVSSDQMQHMVDAMCDITEASRKIGEIIATIEDIAFQTNILALNAAVEAARAGTAGKGFAVVSNEVRSLAAQSDRAAKATRELIENSVNASERGGKIVDEVSQTLQKTLELVVASSNEIGEIATAVQGEAESIAQVTEGISQISAVVQTNSASSEESAAVSMELFEQVRLLQEQTRRFHLKQM